MAAPAGHFEARWPPILVVAGTAAVLNLLPEHVQVLPRWAAWTATILLLATLLGAAVTRGARPWVRAERAVVLVVGALFVSNTIAELADMVGMVTRHPSGANAYSLLSSSLAIWAVNIVVFSLLFWQMDAGGPQARSGGPLRGADWSFPRPEAGSDDPEPWRPLYLDYLFLSYYTAVAFSPTDALPLTRRAKAAMMVESAISMLTLVIVVSRAINVLPN